jgi:molecular chaperone GrpE
MNDTPDEAANQSGPEQTVDSTAQQADTGQNNQAQAQELATLKAENAEMRERMLRTMAEMENLRRRTEREKTDMSKYAVSEFARDVVAIGDNLRRAIEAALKESRDENPALRTLLEGVEVTERELFKVLEKYGITRFDPLGEKFDPHVHEAMVKVDVPGAGVDQIVQVLHAGYKIADRVLRPAAVIVAKGGTPARPEPVPAPEPDSGAGYDAGPNGRDRQGLHVSIVSAQEHDPDVLRGPGGAPRNPQGQPRPRPVVEKRSSSMTRSIREDLESAGNKDELISTFGRRLDNNSSGG